MFYYLLCEKMYVVRNLEDDVLEYVKKWRFVEVIVMFCCCVFEVNVAEVGRTYLVFVEGASKKDFEV